MFTMAGRRRMPRRAAGCWDGRVRWRRRAAWRRWPGRRRRSDGHGVVAQALPDFTVTQEKFGVTAVTNAILKAPGTPSEQFVPVLRAVVTTEFTHVQALEAIGARPLTSRFWIPDAVFDGGVGLFTSLAVVEAIEVSLYSSASASTRARSDAFGARLCAEALGTEAEHRVLARFAASLLGAPTAPPNNVGFEPFPYRTTDAVMQALTGLGIGYGRPGSAPGAFYDYPRRSARQRRRRAGREHDARVRRARMDLSSEPARSISPIPRTTRAPPERGPRTACPVR